jgi:L-asparaginase II
MLAATVGVPAHVPLVHLRRGGMVEGVHHGSTVLVAPDGTVLFAAGDVETAIYPRSAAKPLQAVAMARLGLSLPDGLLALTAASHSGEDVHVAGARRILESGGLGVEHLGNPADLPYDPVEREAWIAAGRSASRLAHNCSGKHAAMLRTCALRGWDAADYLSPDHPLQREVASTVAELTGQPVARTAVDGCGSPLFAVSLRGLARAVGRISAAPVGTPERRVADAMRAHPEMVAGSRRDVTALMRSVPGLVAKDGFEGVQVAALADGTALAVKIADGADRARLPVTVAALVAAGVDPDLLAPFAPVEGPDGLAVADDVARALVRLAPEDTASAPKDSAA